MSSDQVENVISYENEDMFYYEAVNVKKNIDFNGERIVKTRGIVSFAGFISEYDDDNIELRMVNYIVKDMSQIWDLIIQVH